MNEVRYCLPEWKVIWLLHRAFIEGWVYGALADRPMGPDDFDPLDKGEGEWRWVRAISKRTRKQLRRYRDRRSSRT